MSTRMPQDISAANRAQDPASWGNRWDFNMFEGAIVPKNSTGVEAMPGVLKRMQIVKGEDGTLSAYVPTLATGAMSWGHNVDIGAEWANGGSDAFAQWDSLVLQQDPKYKIIMAVRWWERDPIVYKCIDLLTKWANSRIKFDSDSDDAKVLADKWCQQAMSFTFRESVFREIFRTGFVPVIKTLIPYVPRNYRANKIPQPEDGNIQVTADDREQIAATERVLERDRAAMGELIKAMEDLGEIRKRHEQGLASLERVQYYEKQVAYKQATWLKNFIPGSYTTLSPLSVEIKGPKEMAWLREPYLKVSGELQQAVKNPSTPKQQEMVSRMPLEVVLQIRNGASEVRLPDNICSVIYGDKADHEEYPTPIVSHAFPALKMKKEMQDMDLATIRSIKNRILVVRVGNDTYPVFDPAELIKVRAAMNSSSRTMTLYWNHTIELEWIEPKRDITDPTKYEGVNSEIRGVFGLIPMFLGTQSSGASLGSSTLSFKGIEATVWAAQQKFVEFLQREVDLLRMALGISAEIRVSMDALNLKDEIKFMAVVMQMYMNGLLDHETALEIMGFHEPSVRKGMEKLKKMREKGLYTPTPSANNMGPDGKPLPGKSDIAGQNKPGGKGGTTSGGKPANSPGADNNANKKGTSQPKKVKATLQHQNDTAYLVYDGDLEDEEVDDVLSAFSTDDRERVMSAAQFRERFGVDVEFTPPWPTLSMTETVSAITAGQSLHAVAMQAASRTLEDMRRQCGGKRAYITAEKRSEIEARALEQAGIAHVEQVIGTKTLPERFQRHFTAVMANLEADCPDFSDPQRKAVAYAICARRAKKSMKS